MPIIRRARAVSTCQYLRQQLDRVEEAAIVDDAVDMAQRAYVLERIAAKQQQQVCLLAYLDRAQIVAPQRLRRTSGT